MNDDSDTRIALDELERLRAEHPDWLTPPPEALPPSAGRDFLAATHAKAVERFAPAEELARLRAAVGERKRAVPHALRHAVLSSLTRLGSATTREIAAAAGCTREQAYGVLSKNGVTVDRAALPFRWKSAGVTG